MQGQEQVPGEQLVAINRLCTSSGCGVTVHLVSQSSSVPGTVRWEPQRAM